LGASDDVEDTPKPDSAECVSACLGVHMHAYEDVCVHAYAQMISCAFIGWRPC
jgi:hypothetical protein